MKYVCPPSKKMIDENIVRFVGFLSLLVLLLCRFISHWFFLFLAFDFLARIYQPNLSVLKWFAILVLHYLIKLKAKMTEAAPKKFATGIGLFFSTLLFALSFTDFELAKNIILIIFAIAISLETFFAYCFGCKIYSWLQFFKNKFKN